MILAFELLICVVIVAAYAGVSSRLKMHHPEVWNELGQPELIHSDLSPANQALFGFLVKGKFFAMSDMRLVFLGVTWYAAFLTAIVVLAKTLSSG